MPCTGIFEFDLPNHYEVSCGEAFRPNIRVREVISDRYGLALICSTEGLAKEARALRPGSRPGGHILRRPGLDPRDRSRSSADTEPGR